MEAETFNPDQVINLTREVLENPSARPKLDSYWLSHETFIFEHLNTNPPNKNDILDLFEAYLEKLRPAENAFGGTIMKADPLLLRKLNCAYGMWAILAENNRRCYVRGDSKRWGNDKGWHIHEKPLVEGHRWNVKARLDHSFGKDGYETKIRLFRQGAKAASQGQTNHCRRLARNLEAQAVHLQADLLAKNTRIPVLKRLSEAKELYEEARELAKGSSQENLMGFRSALCDLRCALVNLDVKRSLQAHNEALDKLKRFDRPEKLFNRPNPWTSLKDFENERSFIWIIQLLKDKKEEGLEQAVDLMFQIVSECLPGVRRSHLEMRQFFLKGLGTFSLQTWRGLLPTPCVTR